MKTVSNSLFKCNMNFISYMFEIHRLQSKILMIAKSKSLTVNNRC